MTLQQYFSLQPRGSKTAMVKELGITKTWLCGVLKNRNRPSAKLALSIESYTKGQVTRLDLRPDLFGEI